jgi:hypothetical protein
MRPGAVRCATVSHAKGSAIASRIRYVREHFGEEGYRKLVEQLSPEDRARVGARILQHEWVPFDLFINTNVAIDRIFGKGDLHLCYEMGRYSAETNLPTLYRLFYRLGTPMFIFRKAAQIWNVHYDSGQIRPVDEGGGRIRIFMESVARPHRAHCLSVLGWAAKSIELSGGTVTEAKEHACRTDGAVACELALQFNT